MWRFPPHAARDGEGAVHVSPRLPGRRLSRGRMHQAGSTPEAAGGGGSAAQDPKAGVVGLTSQSALRTAAIVQLSRTERAAAPRPPTRRARRRRSPRSTARRRPMPRPTQDERDHNDAGDRVRAAPEALNAEARGRGRQPRRPAEGVAGPRLCRGRTSSRSAAWTRRCWRRPIARRAAATPTRSWS